MAGRKLSSPKSCSPVSCCAAAIRASADKSIGGRPALRASRMKRSTNGVW